MKNKAYLLLLIFTFTFTMLRADENPCINEEVKKCECCGENIEPSPVIASYNFPDKLYLCASKKAYVNGSFIYWEPIEQGLDLAILTPADLNDRYQEVVTLKYEYDPGFKVGFGYNFAYDNWSAYVEYTRFHSTQKTRVTRPDWVSSNTLLWMGGATNLADFYEEKWKIHLDMLDFELGRKGYFGKKFVLNPFAGLKGGWIDQSLRITAFDIASSKTDSWLVGFRAGLFSKWMLGKGFNLFGKTAGNLMYQKFSDVRFSNTENGILDSRIRMKTSFVAPSYELMLGLGWETDFDKKHWHFDFSLGYEFQCFWNQNIMEMVRIILGEVNASPGDLMFHGLSAKLRFDF